MNPRILLYVGLVLAVINCAHPSVPPQQQLPLVNADYQRCVTVETGPLEKAIPLYPNRKNVA